MFLNLLGMWELVAQVWGPGLVEVVGSTLAARHHWKQCSSHQNLYPQGIYIKWAHATAA